jgi:dTDP-4-dehydrorhamnose 3,5-epimerase
MGVSLSWMNRLVSLGIDWRIPTEHANLSEKDTKHEVLKEFESPFEY